MKVKIFQAITLFVMLAIGCNAYAADIYKGSHYQGIGKVKGQPIDLWMDLVVDDGDLDFNMANAVKCTAEYTISGQGVNPIMTVKLPGIGNVPFKTTDGGQTLTGKMTRMGQTIDVWLLKIPATLAPSSLPTEELDAIVGNPDGYTAFVIVEMPNGQKMCATSDFVLSADDHSFKMTCDLPSLQNIFGKMQGSYKVAEGSLTMTDAGGVTKSGKIFDNGNYITIPMGSSQGMTLSLVLIR